MSNSSATASVPATSSWCRGATWQISLQMSSSEQDAVSRLLREAHAYITQRFSPDGFNVGINVGKAAGQNRMHVHVHLIPRYAGDVADPKGGVRAVLSKT